MSTATSLSGCAGCSSQSCSVERQRQRATRPTACCCHACQLISRLIRDTSLLWLRSQPKPSFSSGSYARFALLENAYYLRSIPDTHLVVWVIRGLGTAVMHGGTTAIFGIVSQLLAEFKSPKQILIFVPGLLTAVVLHSLFNHLFFSPLFSMLVTLLVFPLLIFVVFERSEQSLQNWLEVGFDADTELLELMNSGRLSESRVGKYLKSLREKFSGEVVMDLLCYLRIHLELSLRAKGILMMREAGFDAEPDDDTRALFQEMKFLERSIGKTGKLALLPFLSVSGKELWQLYMIGK
ncbi:MAG: hypothetical protein DMG49_12795 [Acidobacteria bacterium]|nr:MAG: hypothetical protein DMG49_12795 [Acidobacteriota bacterium]